MFFENWSQLGRTAVVGVLAYLVLVFFLRISGKRTLSHMDPFDFVITTALGSALAQVALSKEIPLVRGVLAFAILIGLQVVATWLSWRSARVRRMIKPEPTLLFYRGRFLRGAMKREHVPEIEVLAAVREQGMASLEEVAAVVLEADSDFSVIRYSSKPESALADVRRKDSEIP